MDAKDMTSAFLALHATSWRAKAGGAGRRLKIAKKVTYSCAV